jgi:hypothetical protein
VEISGGTGQEREGRGFRERESRRFLAGREQGKGAPSVMGKGARCAWECATERDGALVVPGTVGEQAQVCKLRVMDL